MPHPQSPLERSSSAYLRTGTIAALSSAAGGALGIIRLSGPRSMEIVSALSQGSWKPQGPRTLSRLRISDGAVLDEGLAVYFPQGASFTGEECVELQLHGGRYTLGRVLEACFARGALPALAGEFSFRALRNGKLSLTQAEAVSELIRASTASAAGLALDKLSGAQNKQIASLSQELKTLCALSELGIDFSDQDVEEVSLPALKRRAQAVFATLSELARSFERGEKIQSGVKTALLGLPNAGKSSFFNALLGQERSIVTEIAGTTRDVVREQLALRSGNHDVLLSLSDTAGLRPQGQAASDRIEALGIERSRLAALEADLLIFVVDPYAIPAALSLWAELAPGAKPTLAVLSKADLLSSAQQKDALQALSDAGFTHICAASSLDGGGLSTATDQIVSLCLHWVARAPGEILLTRQDHLRAVQTAMEHLLRAHGAQAEDLFAADIRQALQSLDVLLGETLADDILGQIFSDFCIGK